MLINCRFKGPKMMTPSQEEKTGVLEKKNQPGDAGQPSNMNVALIL